MKKLLQVAIAAIMFGCNNSPKVVKKEENKPAQKKSTWFPIPIGDSTYVDVKSDTVLGRIRYPVGGGMVFGKGFVVTSKVWQGHMPIYSKEDTRKIDSILNHDGQGFIITGDAFLRETTKDAYIITKHGNKVVAGDFTFSPY